MSYVLANHKVQDYKEWKAAFDSVIETRKAGGELSYHIFHAKDDTNNLTLIFKWDSLENAEKFLTSPELKSAMQKAGVIGEPHIHFLKEFDHGTL